jgi:hypothetical protein
VLRREVPPTTHGRAFLGCQPRVGTSWLRYRVTERLFRRLFARKTRLLALQAMARPLRRKHQLRLACRAAMLQKSWAAWARRGKASATRRPRAQSRPDFMNPVDIVGSRSSAFRLSGLICSVLLGCNELLGIQPGELAEGGRSARETVTRGGSGIGAGGGPGGAGPTGGANAGVGGVPQSNSGGATTEGGSSSGETTSSSGGVSAFSTGGTTSSSGGVSSGGTNAGGVSSGGTAATGGASSTSTTSCVGCEGRQVRMVGAALTGNVIGNREVSRTFMDMCPDGQALVGLRIRTARNNLVGAPNFEGIGAICGPLEIQGTSIGVGTELLLPMRGVDGAVASVRCPAGEVVSDLWGGWQTSPISPTIIGVRCSKLGLTRLDREARVDVAPTGNVDHFGGDSSEVGTAACPMGQIANGLFIRANTRVDAVGITCSTPLLAYPEGATCSMHADCLSAYCVETCKPLRCPPVDNGCVCTVYQQTPYMLCTAARTRKTAEYSCGTFTSKLPRLDSPYELGWLSTTLFQQSASRFWIGAKYDDGWKWDVDGTAIAPPKGGPTFSFWRNDAAADPSGGKNCLVLDGGNYVSANCDETHPFACQLAQ